MSAADKARTLADFCRWLARPVLLFYALPWLMALLAIGTVAQARIGLYEAHHQFFGTWIVWWGPLPFPGAYLTLALITLSLTAKFLLGSPWDRARAGTTLTHLGVLVLLYGGLATALTQREGYIVIPEGGSGASLSSYHDRVLKIYREGEVAEQIPFAALRAGKAVASEIFPFTLTPAVVCRNCSADLIDADKAADDSVPRHGMAEKVALSSLPPETQDEINLSGLMFRVSGSGETDGLYASLEEVPMIPQFTDEDGVTYGVQMGRETRALPFSLQLVDFVREDYPGTFEPRAYHSDIIVEDGALSWPVRIEMNAPLRYRGYTFYQSSFSIAPDGTEKTVLSGVRNTGWLFPYLASAIVFAGLCLHLFQRLARGRDA